MSASNYPVRDAWEKLLDASIECVRRRMFGPYHRFDMTIAYRNDARPVTDLYIESGKTPVEAMGKALKQAAREYETPWESITIKQRTDQP